MLLISLFLGQGLMFPQSHRSNESGLHIFDQDMNHTHTHTHTHIHIHIQTHTHLSRVTESQIPIS